MLAAESQRGVPGAGTYEVHSAFTHTDHQAPMITMGFKHHKDHDNGVPAPNAYDA